MDLFDDFKGRDTELATLSARLEQVKNGSARLVLVAGARGSGKSALLAKFARDRAWKKERIRALLLRAPASGSWNAISQAASETRGRWLRAIGKGRGGSPARARLIIEWVGALPVVGGVLAAMTATATAVRRRGMLASLRMPAEVNELCAAARRRPMVLLIDDADLMERDGVVALDLLMRSANAAAPCALLVVAAHTPTGRAEKDSGIEQLARILPPEIVTELRIAPLTSTAHAARDDGRESTPASLEALSPALLTLLRDGARIGDVIDAMTLASSADMDELAVEDLLDIAVRAGILIMLGEVRHPEGDTTTAYRFADVGVRQWLATSSL